MKRESRVKNQEPGTKIRKQERIYTSVNCNDSIHDSIKSFWRFPGSWFLTLDSNPDTCFLTLGSNLNSWFLSLGSQLILDSQKI